VAAVTRCRANQAVIMQQPHLFPPRLALRQSGRARLNFSLIAGYSKIERKLLAVAHIGQLGLSFRHPRRPAGGAQPAPPVARWCVAERLNGGEQTGRMGGDRGLSSQETGVVAPVLALRERSSLARLRCQRHRMPLAHGRWGMSPQLDSGGDPSSGGLVTALDAYSARA
jgi:hypothetical protein